jgi:para-nitrobenzyl esterase
VDLTPVTGPGWRRGEDYLTLDVWSPDIGAGGLPVIVFLHGGAFVAGTGSAASCDGSGFARAGTVLVTINYRVGAEGFLPVPGGATNIGLRDQIAAVE